MFAVIGAVRRRFLVTIKETTEISINSFTGSVPARYLNCPKLGAVNLPVIITRAVIDENEDSIELEVWG